MSTPSGSMRTVSQTASVPFVIAILAVLLVVSFGTAVYYYRKFSSLKANPQKIAQEDIGALVTDISKIFVLPANESPTVATVADPERLKSQPFFAQAKVGDKVLIYTNARRAILYRPSEHRIIEVAPLNIGTSEQSPTPNAPSTATNTQVNTNAR